MNRRLSVASAGVFAILATSALSPAHAQRVTTLGSNNTLVTFGATEPGVIGRTRVVSGLAAGDTLLGIDARSATPRVFYASSVDAAGTSSQLYAINVITGRATAVGARVALPAGVTGTGYDFNPVPDRIRLVLSNGDNLRINPDTGAIVGTDTDVFFRVGDRNFGDAPNIVGAAYTNPTLGARRTTLYAIDAANGVLVRQGGFDVPATVRPEDAAVRSPNGGQLTTIGVGLGAPTTGATGFNITADGRALATLTDPVTGVTSIYRVNLTSGRATLLGQIGAGAGATYTGLAFQLDPFQTFGVTPNQVSVGVSLDRYTSIPPLAVTRLFASLDALPDGERVDAIDQISARSYSTLPDVAFQLSEFIDTSVRRYLRDTRAGHSDDPNRQTAIDRRLAFWLSGSGRFGSLSKSDTRDRAELGGAGLIGGVDYRFTPTAFAGIFGGYDNTDVRLNRRSRASDSDSWFVGGYASYERGSFYVDAHGSYADSDWNLKRTVVFGNFNREHTAESKSRQWTAAGTVGARLAAAGLEVEPYAGVRFVDLAFSDFSEFGSAARLSIAEADIEQLQSIAGLKLGTRFDAGPAVVRASLRGEYRHEFENGDRDFLVRFKEPSLEVGMRFQTDDYDRDFAAIGAGLTVAGRTAPWTFFADYTGQVSGGYDIHGVQGGFRFTF